MGKLIDTKPKGGMIEDDRPSETEINKDLSNKLITRSVEALTPYGLLLVWTHPETETFTTEYNP